MKQATEHSIKMAAMYYEYEQIQRISARAISTYQSGFYGRNRHYIWLGRQYSDAMARILFTMPHQLTDIYMYQNEGCKFQSANVKPVR